jgi:uncharacterized protein (TIGR03435 family)
MKLLNVVSLALLSWGGLAQAQPPNPSQHFDAASVKPAGPIVLGVDYSLRGGPGTASPGQIDYPGVTLQTLVMRAYDVDGDQVSCPAWMLTERYAVRAKLPGNSSKKEFQLMLQALLADRFHLTLYRTAKEVAGYDLVVANGGHKMKPAAPEEEPPQAVAAGYHPMKIDANGFPEKPGVYMGGGMARLREHATMEQLARELGGAVRAATGPVDFAPGAMPPSPRVVDKTGLTGKFDFTLEYAAAIPRPGNLPMLANRPPPDPSAPTTASDPGGTAGPSIFTAVEKQLGLKLVKTANVSVDVLVVDHADKVPTEN